MKPLEITLILTFAIIIGLLGSVFMPATDSLIWYQLPGQFKETNK